MYTPLYRCCSDYFYPNPGRFQPDMSSHSVFFLNRSAPCCGTWMIFSGSGSYCSVGFWSGSCFESYMNFTFVFPYFLLKWSPQKMWCWIVGLGTSGVGWRWPWSSHNMLHLYRSLIWTLVGVGGGGRYAKVISGIYSKPGRTYVKAKIEGTASAGQITRFLVGVHSAPRLPPSPPSPVSKLSLFLGLPMCR